MVFSFPINELAHLCGRLAKLKIFSIPEKEQRRPQDAVNISSDGKKRQIMDQARTDALDTIRKTR